MPPSSGVKIEVGGRSRTLRLTVRALDRVETETGLPWPQMAVRVDHGSMRYTIWALWAAFLHEEPDLERSTVIDWLDDLDAEGHRGLMESLVRAIKDATGDEEEGAEEGNAEAAA